MNVTSYCLSTDGGNRYLRRPIKITSNPRFPILYHAIDRPSAVENGYFFLIKKVVSRRILMGYLQPLKSLV